MTTIKPNKPRIKPNNPHFSSGPCRKRPGWSPAVLNHALLGRSHRSQEGKDKLAKVIELSKTLLGIPKDYKVGIVPASDTGAVEMALWSLLGPKTVDVFAWESFSQTWLTDIVSQLNLPHRAHLADYGELPDFSHYHSDNDCVFVFNGTTSGVRIPDLTWIADDREGLTICDATSAVFSQAIDFQQLDVTTWSWQKALGGEAAHGMIALSPRAIKRLQTHTPAWPMPKIFRLVKDGQLMDDVFSGSTINTPSMLCTEDAIDSLTWLQSMGGGKAAQAISDQSLSIISDWVATTPWVDFLAKEAQTRSNTSVCLIINDDRFTQKNEGDQQHIIQAICQLLANENVAYDIKSYKSAPPGLRIWTGATVESADVKALLPWINWAFYQVIDR